MMYKSTIRAIENHLIWANDLAFKLVVDKARSIMKSHSRINEFVMGMGSYSFWDKNSNQIDSQKYKYLIEFDKMIVHLESLGILVAGNPIKLKWYHDSRNSKYDFIFDETNW